MEDKRELGWLNKSRSRNTIVLYEDIDDPWFVDVVTKVKKTGEVTRVSHMIRKDVEYYLDMLTREGWVWYKKEGNI
jgi:hypothetical protein